MSNGSIGIAGPRGAGKSTLIDSICNKQYAENENVLSVKTSAPVDYDPREFLLHIFSLVCNEYIKRKRLYDDYYEPIHLTYYDNDYVHNLLERHKRDLIIYDITYLISIILFFTGSFFLIKSNYFINYQSILDKFQSPIFYLFISIILFILTIISFLFSRDGYKFIRLRQKRHFHNYRLRNEDRYLKIAEENLKMITFQSSYSSGWSGELNIPIGVKGGINSTTTLSQNMLSLPEIVNAYCKFIELISTDYKVIIGIDELDKISTSDKAFHFLNEIKGIFNLKNCYYLISVSENAMSNFNKRGMPFRDAFDSSFDDILYVNYLDFESAKELIKRRIIGMSVPFMCLCYLMSGGLPRDLIRVCRDLADFLELNPENNSLSFLSNELIKKDIMSKVNAIKIDCKEINLEDNHSIQELIEEIYKLEESLELKSSLKVCCLNLMSSSRKLDISNSLEYNEQLKLYLSKTQVGTYLYYVLTIREFFGEKIEESIFKNDENLCKFDELANAHQLLGYYPKLAEKIITDFRIKYRVENIYSN